MQLSGRQQRNLEAIVDTIAPGDPAAGIAPASQLGVVDTAMRFVNGNPRASERRQLAALLSGWDTSLVQRALTGTPGRFTTASQQERERRLLALADSESPTKRVLFQSLKGAALLPYYMNASRPLLESMGVQPFEPPRSAPGPRPLRVQRPNAATTYSCDVVVVGSGAGGGVAAGVLAEAGLDVLVLEAGEYRDDQDFDGQESTGFLNSYALAPQSTRDGQMLLMAGRGLGGGTVINYSTSFRTRPGVREEWAGHGLPQFTTREYDGALDAVCERIGVNTDHDEAAPRDEVLERGLRKLGWHSGAMPRNVVGCDMGEVCGRCGMGCPLGAKQSTTKTFLADAAAMGARLVVGVQARRVLTLRGRAVGVEAITAKGQPVRVHARAVVIAAGAIQTPTLLQRSGLTNRNIGRHLRLHPATAVWAELDEPVRPWTGAMQSRFSDEHIDLDGQGYGVLYETAPTTPALASGFLPWRGGEAHLRRMQALDRVAPMVVILRDKDSVGRVRAARDGEPVVTYELSPGDREHLMRGFEGAARIAEAAGARSVYAPYQEEIGFEVGAGTPEEFANRLRAAGTAPGRLTLASLHIMGSCRMGGSQADSALDPDGRTWEVENLVVADGSCFPTASGTNPMVSIMAIAHMNATRLAAELV